MDRRSPRRPSSTIRRMKSATITPTERQIIAERLHFFAAKGHRRELAMLVDSGADLETTDADGNTAVVLAAVHCKPECVEILAHAGANLDKLGCLGCTPLICMIVHRESACARSLIQHGCDIDMPSDCGRTPIMFAVEGLPDILSALLKNGADLDAVDFQGRSVEDWARRHDRLNPALAMIGAERARREALSISSCVQSVLEDRAPTRI